MSTAFFQLAYDGEAVRSGSMDVHELAPALLAVGDLVKEANAVLNENRASVSVRVESDFKRSSFEISLLIDQSILEQAKALLTGHSVMDAETLLAILFGTPSVAAIITGLIKIFRALKGEKPKQITVYDQSTNTTIVQTGSGQILNNVDRFSAELYSNDAVRDAMKRIILPVEEKGIDELAIRIKGATIDTVTKEDAGCFVAPMDASGQQIQEITSTREAYLRIDKPSFVPGQSWRFSDGAVSFGAKISDKEFEHRVQAREEGFFSGDRLHAKLRTVQRIDSTGEIKTETVVEHIIKHLPAPKQARLPGTD